MLASFGFVILANLARTSFLVWAAANRGMHQMEAWHDTAGILVMVIVLAGLMVMAHWLRPSTPVAASTTAAEPRVLAGMPRWPGVAALVWLAAAQLATEVWYRAHESNLVPNARWSIAWPMQNAQFRKTDLPENALAILRCSDSKAASWQDDDGNQWSAFLLRWAPGKNSAQLAKGHRPDVCLPASGARMIEDFGPVTVRTAVADLPFQHQSFESRDQVLHVFYCLWSDKRSMDEPALVEDGSRSSRFRAVMAGKRNLGQRVLELVVAGPDTSEGAVSLLQAQLSRLIQPD
jgi:hypothetical protein